MRNRRWGRRLLVAAIWAMAMSTWGSIGHHLLGLPDLGPLMVAVAVAVVLTWPLPLRHRAAPARSMPAQPGHPS